MEKNQLRELVRGTLIDLGFYSESALKLVLGTIAQESAGGYYIEQIKGPARGICQMEPATFNWLVDGYLTKHKDVMQRIMKICNIEDLNAQTLRYNLKLSICMCRVRYLVDPQPLPEPGNLEAIAGTWKRVYNTYKGAGTEKQFLKNYKKYVS